MLEFGGRDRHRGHRRRRKRAGHRLPAGGRHGPHRGRRPPGRARPVRRDARGRLQDVPRRARPRGAGRRASPTSARTASRRRRPRCRWCPRRPLAPDRSPPAQQDQQGPRAVRPDPQHRSGGPRAGRRRAAPRVGKRSAVLLQVNLAEKETQFGLSAAELGAAARTLAGADGLILDGLMCIAPVVDDPEAARPTFRRLAALFGELEPELRERRPPLAPPVDGDVPRLPRRRGGGGDARPRRPGHLRRAAGAGRHVASPPGRLESSVERECPSARVPECPRGLEETCQTSSRWPSGSSTCWSTP